VPNTQEMTISSACQCTTASETFHPDVQANRNPIQARTEVAQVLHVPISTLTTKHSSADHMDRTLYEEHTSSLVSLFTCFRTFIHMLMLKQTDARKFICGSSLFPTHWKQ